MGNWYADDIDLGTLAQNVQNRSAGWSTAERRGENIRVPGRPGSLHVEKSEDENTLVLDMWARGMEADGSIPLDTTREKKVVERLDALARLFGSGKLIELVRADDGVDYGRTNWIPNPSAEKSGGKVVVRENQVQNPSAEYSGGKRVIRWNLLPNPSMEDGGRTSILRTNYSYNPRFGAEGRTRVHRLNLVPNPSLEAAIMPWSRQGAVGQIRRSSYKQSSPKWPAVGRWSMRMNSTSAADPRAVSAPFRVKATTSYAFQAQVLNKSGATRTFRMSVRWRNRRGALLRADTIDATNVVNNGLGSPQGTLTSPAGAYQCVVHLVMLGATAAGQDCYWDAIMVEEATAVNAYFDGDTDWANGYRYRWQRGAGTSQSEAYTVLAHGWYSPGGNRIAGITEDYARAGSQSLMVECTNAPPDRQLLVRPVIKYGADLSPRDIASASMSVMLGPNVPADRNIVCALECYDSKGTMIGKAYNPGTTVEHTDVVTTLEAGTWIDVEVENVELRPRTARCGLALYTSTGWALGDVIYVDRAMVENAALLGDYFDGYTRDTDTFTYRWTARAHSSASEVVGTLVTSWTTGPGKAYQFDDSLTGDYCLRLEAPRLPDASQRLWAQATPIDIRSGRAHSLSVNVRPSRAMSVRLERSSDAGRTWTSSTAVVAAANEWTRLSMVNFTFGTTTEEFARVRVITDEAPQDLDVLDIEDAMLEPVADLRDYFDGNSGRNFRWYDDEHTSISEALGWGVDGWSPFGTAHPSLERVLDGSHGSYAAEIVAAEAGNMGITWGQDGIDEDLGYGLGVDVNPTVAGTVRVGVNYFDKKGTEVSSEYTDVAVLAGAWTRVTHVTVNPHADAVVASPFVLYLNAAVSATMKLDAALFGFGAWTDYKDGDSGSGWEWTESDQPSESQEIDTVPHHWNRANGTLQQDSLWSTSRTQSALYTSTSSTGPWWFGPEAEGEHDYARFLPKFGQDATFSVDVRALDPCQVRLVMDPWVWNGWGWRNSDEPTYVGAWEEFAASATKRMFLTQEIGGRTYDTTHFSLRIEVQGSGGVALPLGTRVKADSAALVFADGPYTDYLDGESGFWYRWQGSQDESPSRRVGPARRAMVETISAINPTSINSDLAKFSVELIVPGVYWEDTYMTKEDFIIGRSGSRIKLNEWIGASAPTNDAIITIWGPTQSLRIYDIGSGAWIDLDFRIRASDVVVIDNNDWTVKRNGRNMMEHVRSDGSAFLLPITPVKDEATPRLRFVGPTIGSGARAQVYGRRRYRIA